MFTCGPVYYENLNATEDIIVNQGGTWSSKTFSLLQVFFSKAPQELGNVFTVVGQDIPNIKRGALRDSQQIISGSSELQSLITSYNASDRIYKFNSGSIIEYTSFSNEQDARSGKRDYLFINEANGIPWEIVEQLINRTRKQVFIDYNPSIPFWAHDKLLVTKLFGTKKVKLIRSWHEHNPFLTADQHEHIERRSLEDPEWGRVYGKGLTGKVEGLIFKNWAVCDSIPTDAKFIGHGLDFGFTNDQTAMPSVYLQDGELWIDLLIYETGLTNPEIAKRALDKGVTRQQEVIADSAEPKSIQEIRNAGLNITAAKKGADSIKASIDILKRYKMNVVRTALPLIKELNSYKWKEDKITGKSTNEVCDHNNHAIDALRYVALNKLSNAGLGRYHFA